MCGIHQRVDFITIHYVIHSRGYISDRFSKVKVMRWAARLAVLLSIIITFCYYMGWFYLAFGLTFNLAVQSAFYSPAKYGYIRDLLSADNLSKGNGWCNPSPW
ncbi:MAG: hypothetical protein COB24_11315 [Hyphomicrobiales bacterium]|nr:MAG: hypothetical protein COB24_11315 [Hyphomicrobiales bacterium]